MSVQAHNEVAKENCVRKDGDIAECGLRVLCGFEGGELLMAVGTKNRAAKNLITLLL